MELTIDPTRVGQVPTGIPIRARGPDGGWGTFDIFDLTRDSLKTWLRSRGGENEWAENVVLILLGHER